MDRRARQLHEKYVCKARQVDLQYVGPIQRSLSQWVGAKLLGFKQVRGVLFGGFEATSKVLHKLIDSLTTSKVTVAGPKRGMRGVEQSLEGDRALVSC